MNIPFSWQRARSLVHTIALQVHMTARTTVMKDFFVYSFGAILLRAMSALIAVYILSPADFGTLSLVSGFITIGAAIAGLGLRQVIAIEYFHRSPEQQRELVHEMITLYVLVMAPLLCLGIYFATPLFSWLFVDSLSTALISIALATIFLSFFVELRYQLLQYEGQSLQLTGIQLFVAVATALLTLTFLWGLKTGFSGAVWAQFGGMCIAFAIGAQTKPSMRMHRLQKHHPLRYMTYLKLGIPFVPGILCAWLLSYADRYILAHYVSMHEVGIYALADTTSQVFHFLILYPWGAAYLPYIMKQFANHKELLVSTEKWNSWVMRWSMCALAVLMSIGFLAGKPLALLILPTHYAAALAYVPIILTGQLFLLGSYFSAAFIQYHKHTIFLACALCVPALLNIALNIMCIPRFGLYGCAWATCASYIIYFCVLRLYNYRLRNKHRS